MKVLIYANPESVEWHRLEKAVLSVVPGFMVKVCHDIQSLSTHLSLPGSRNKVSVLCVLTAQEPDHIWGIRDLLAETRVIMLLPDRDKQTVSKGHRFYPRFLSYVDGDFTDVGSVLQRMLEMDRFRIQRDISKHE